MNFLIFAIVFIFGTLIGSFLNVVIWRLPRGQHVGGRSQCPHCSAILRPQDLVPLLSYVFLKRRCRQCHTSISFRYALIEFATGFIFAWCWLVIHPASLDSFFMVVRMLVIASFFIAIFCIDFEHYLILDKLVIPACFVALASNMILDSFHHVSWFLVGGQTGGGIVAAAGLSGFFFVLWAVSGGRWIGLGDVKLAVLLGLVVGWPLVLVSTMLAFFLGTLVSVILLMRGAKGLKSAVPFGTFLTVGALIALWYGSGIWQWYLHLIGL